MDSSPKDTYRARLWLLLSKLTEAAFKYAVENEGVQENSAHSWLSLLVFEEDGKLKTGDTFRQTLHHVKKASVNPLHIRGARPENIYKFIDKVLMGRVPKADIDELVDFFETKFWPMEQVWINVRASKSFAGYSEVMEELLRGDSLKSLTNDLERLIAWAKHSLSGAFEENRYAEASQAASAIIWQLHHLESEIEHRHREVFRLAKLRIFFHCLMTKANVGWPELDPAAMLCLEDLQKMDENKVFAPAENETFKVLTAWQAIFSGVGRPVKEETTLRLSALLLYGFHWDHELARRHHWCGDLDDDIAMLKEMDLVPEYYDTPRYGLELMKNDVKKHVDEYMKSEEFRKHPRWASDPDGYIPAIVACSRLLRKLGREGNLGYFAKVSRGLMASQFGNLGEGAAFRSLKIDEKENDMAILSAMRSDDSEITRKRLQSLRRDIEEDALGMIEGIKSEKNLVALSEFYIFCSRYFEITGHQYGAVLGRERALSAIRSTDHISRKEDLAKEVQRIKMAGVSYGDRLSETGVKLLKFVEETPAFIADEHMRSGPTKRR